MTKLHKAALIRAYRTFLQTLLATIPMGASVNFVNGIDYKVIGFTILGMVGTALIASIVSFIQGVLKGLPEAVDDDFDEEELKFHELNNSLTDKELGINCGGCEYTTLECNNQCMK